MSKAQTVGRYQGPPKIKKNCDHSPSGKKQIPLTPALHSPRIKVGKRG